MGKNKEDIKNEKVEDELVIEEMDEDEVPKRGGKGTWKYEVIKKDLEERVKGLKPGKVLVMDVNKAYSKYHGGDIHDGNPDKRELGARRWYVTKAVEKAIPIATARYSGDSLIIGKKSQ